MELEKFYKEDDAFYRVVVGDINVMIGPRSLHSCTIFASLRTSVGLKLNRTKTMFMSNRRVSCVLFSLYGTNISKYSSSVYLRREVDMANNLVQS
ncbi:unnamed protein product [Heligmosomoides polygyrus]|uniref:Reverse transcriptase domain-containing protein n=1 Tax=Heligmosomoides polygyrus TaxID=6339 RepID=A0A183G325_HELPZ|nr:unnamed protein product [Heligmosomoides polygyrus]